LRHISPPRLNLFIGLQEKRDFSGRPMPISHNVKRCTHIKVTGHRCGSPALRGRPFCYFHMRLILGVQTRVDSQINPMAILDNEEAIQAALMHVIDALLRGTLDSRRGALVLKALYIAVKNSRRVRFDTHQDDMVREVPNYARQYLDEHPELDEPCGADTLVREPSAPEQNCLPERPSFFSGEEAHESKDALFTDVDDDSSRSSQRESKTGPDLARPLTSRQSREWHDLKRLEASVDGALRGDLHDLKTVFRAIGLDQSPSDPP
jgi:hypothetical protein